MTSIRLFVGVALAGCVLTVSAQSYPSKPIRIIIGFPAGSAGDAQLRLVGQKLYEAWGRSLVVDSRPGASGNIAAELAVKSPADGYTLLYFPAALAVNPSLFPKVPYDIAKDFTPITLLASFPLVLVVHPTLPARTVAELIALAKAKPGAINFASIGNASPPHLAGELFNQLARVNMVHVPYKGSGPAQADLVGGHVQLMFDTAVAAMPNIKAGRTRPLAVTTKMRSALLPDLPSLEESGLRGYDLYGWGGIVGPAGVPADIVHKLQREIAKALKQPDVAEKLAALGADPSGMPPEEFGRFILAEAAKWKQLIISTGAKID
jgi:tripartite-type tricarboxylate transporter receptor subunit TctC